jgi:hypothetical protein
MHASDLVAEIVDLRAAFRQRNRSPRRFQEVYFSELAFGSLLDRFELGFGSLMDHAERKEGGQDRLRAGKWMPFP